MENLKENLQFAPKSKIKGEESYGLCCKEIFNTN